MIFQRFIGQMPEWARPSHPLLRHELGQGGAPPRWQTRYLRALGVVLLGAVGLLVGVIVATGAFTHAAGQNVVESFNAILYFPLLIAQVILRVAAFSMTAGTVGEQVRQGKWDNVRATESGAELTLRARWVSVYFRLRALFAVVILLRLILIGLMLYDLTSFQGRHLDLALVGITPEVPLPLAVLLLAFVMTAALLLPLTSLGLDAAMGVLISVNIHQRTLSTLTQALYVLARLALTAGLVIGASAFLGGSFTLSDPAAWVLLLFFGATGDWGLSFLLLSRSAEVWATVPYGIVLGLAMLIFALVQAGAADALLVWSARRAERRG